MYWMNDHIYTCKRCHTPLQGRADYCIACFARVAVPCGQCVNIDRHGNQHVKRHRKTGEQVDCSWCKNKRYIIVEDAR